MKHKSGLVSLCAAQVLVEVAQFLSRHSEELFPQSWQSSSFLLAHQQVHKAAIYHNLIHSCMHMPHLAWISEQIWQAPPESSLATTITEGVLLSPIPSHAADQSWDWNCPAGLYNHECWCMVIIIINFRGVETYHVRFCSTPCWNSITNSKPPIFPCRHMAVIGFRVCVVVSFGLLQEMWETKSY